MSSAECVEIASDRIKKDAYICDMKAKYKKAEKGAKMGGPGPKKTGFKSKKDAEIFTLEAKIKKAKGTPQAAALVKRYRELTGVK